MNENEIDPDENETEHEMHAIAIRMLNDRFTARDDFISDSDIDEMLDHANHDEYDAHEINDARCESLCDAIFQLTDDDEIVFPL